MAFTQLILYSKSPPLFVMTGLYKSTPGTFVVPLGLTYAIIPNVFPAIAFSS